MSDKHESNEPHFNPLGNRYAELWFEPTSTAIGVLVNALTTLVRPVVASIEDDERRVSRERWDDFWVALPGKLDGNGPELSIFNLRSGPTDPLRSVYVTKFEQDLKVKFSLVTDVPSLHAVESFNAQVIEFAHESGAVQGLMSPQPRSEAPTAVSDQVLSPYHYSTGVSDQPGQFDPHLTVFVGAPLLVSLQNRDLTTADRVLTSPGAVRVFDLPDALVEWLNPELLAYWDGPNCDYDYEAGERETQRVKAILDSICLDNLWDPI